MNTKELQSIVSTNTILKSNKETAFGKDTFWSPLLAQFSLPQRKVDGSAWTVNNEFITLKTTSNSEMPYGAYPRLLLSYVTLQIIKTDSQVLDLGKTQNQFLKMLDLGCDGKTIQRFNLQALNLFRSTIEIEIKPRSETRTLERKGTFHELIHISDRCTFWEGNEENSKKKWLGELLVNKNFFDFVKSMGGMPFNFHRYASLTRSSMAMDLYIWLPYSLLILQQRRHYSASFKFFQLQQKFDANSSLSRRDFKIKFLNCLSKVLRHYPDFYNNVKLSEDGKQLVMTKPKKSVELIVKKDSKSSL